MKRSMLSTWKKYRLGDLSTKITKGTTPSTVGGKFLDSGINYIKSEAVSYEGRIDTSTFVHIDEETHEKLKRSQLEKDDILFSMAGIFLGKTGIVKPEMLPANTNQALAIIRLNKTLADPKFVQLFLRMPDTVRFVNNMSAQSAQPNINLEEVGSLELDLPPLREQQCIAEILSSLDDKIELNLQINKTLEEMANALFKHWFVDFGPFKEGKFVESELGMIPEGWNIETFSNIYELRKGLSYKSAFYSEDGIPMINLKCVDRNGGFRYDGIKYYKGEYKPQHVVTHGDLLVAMTDLTQDRSVVGSPLLAPKIKSKSDVIASLDLSILKQTDGDFPNLNLYFYYLMRTKQYHEYILGFGNGSTVVHLDKMGIVNYRALLPTRKVVEDFNNLVVDIRTMIESNREENDSLAATRNYLLPKLISGEIRVKDAAKAVKEIA